MTNTTSTTTTNTKATSAGGVTHASAVPPIGLVLVGLVALTFWAWGNLVQIQTSEALILGSSSHVSLVPNWHVLGQPIDFFAGRLSPDMMKAATWGWGLEALLLVFSMGIEYARIVHKHAGWFNTGAVVLLAINSWADFQYGSLGTGFWGQLAFAAMTLFLSFFFGLVGLHLIFSGFARMR